MLRGLILLLKLLLLLLLYDASFLAADLLNLRSFLKIHLQKPKGCLNNRQTLYYNRSTFGANRRRHCATMAHFLRVPFNVKSRFFYYSQEGKWRQIGYVINPSYLSDFVLGALTVLVAGSTQWRRWWRS